MTKKILIVDDEADILTLETERLKRAGYDILTADSAEGAINLLAKNAMDLILLDLVLPKMQGDALCKLLKSNDRLKNIPIIIFTASSIRMPENFAELGADDYLLKPFEAADLMEKIKKFIG